MNHCRARRPYSAARPDHGRVARSVAALVALLCALPAACASTPPGPFADPLTTPYAAELGVDLAAFTRLPGGTWLRDVAEGSGTAATTRSEVRLHYSLYLPDGRLVQTTRGEAPLETRLDTEQFIIAGAIPGMKAGGRRTIVVPPARGYGREGVPGLVPPNATLVFDVELVEVRPGR